ncbi:hypothetical protein PC129_g17040 [Phytophthora cactorum]|uniref:Uncharacterized protein n=1 Tax=Phytophthora cactorum TaxID=29920 RepID=A0A8T1F515_9STRA|nr:hypothetical protein PC111_g18310 [Phytophthora cactorum]KAG2968372.1 hypothetical protein PC118_g18038 [Phytophthora cactorum]KAG3211988.1 hypothetical protein PC129_g17040 [Phytophthora cactorum]KAG4057417.1 hypothetical protein PC123_g7572 [Phytophthora cactorum]KAG4228477.1 hypothetical protein PC116_g23166 [Phytophthora cactorum]
MRIVICRTLEGNSRVQSFCSGNPKLASKKKKSISTKKRMKAPESDEEGAGSGKISSIWNENTLERAYNRKVLQELLGNDPVVRIVQLRQIGDPKGQVPAPPATSDKLEAVKILFQLLKDAGLATGAFDADDLFDLDINDIQLASSELYRRLKMSIGEEASVKQLQTSPCISTTEHHSESSQYAPASGSDLSVAPRRLSLGPSGATMVRSRLKEGTMISPDSRKKPQIEADQDTDQPASWTSRQPWIGSSGNDKSPQSHPGLAHRTTSARKMSTWNRFEAPSLR